MVITFKKYKDQNGYFKSEGLKSTKFKIIKTKIDMNGNGK